MDRPHRTSRVSTTRRRVRSSSPTRPPARPHRARAGGSCSRRCAPPSARSTWPSRRTPGTPQELAAAAAGERRPLVVSLGGDGTLNEIVNGLMAGGRRRVRRAGRPPAASLSPRLGIVATGTGGDFGRSLGIPQRFEAYVAAIASGRERPVDVGLAALHAAANGEPTAAVLDQRACRAASAASSTSTTRPRRLDERPPRLRPGRPCAASSPAGA